MLTWYELTEHVTLVAPLIHVIIKLYLSQMRYVYTRDDLILRGPRASSFWVPRNLSHNMDRQARTGDTVLVKSIEMTGRIQTLRWWLGGVDGF
jgi:hypothetical protein